jgi:hypothetical protein
VAHNSAKSSSEPNRDNRFWKPGRGPERKCFLTGTTGSVDPCFGSWRDVGLPAVGAVPSIPEILLCARYRRCLVPAE